MWLSTDPCYCGFDRSPLLTCSVQSLSEHPCPESRCYILFLLHTFALDFAALPPLAGWDACVGGVSANWQAAENVRINRRLCLILLESLLTGETIVCGCFPRSNRWQKAECSNKPWIACWLCVHMLCCNKHQQHESVVQFSQPWRTHLEASVTG